jgi:transposase
MTDILRLPGWTPISIDENDERMIIHAECTGKPEVCQACGVVGAPLYKHGQRDVTFLDTPIGKPTRILARVQRYRCRECGGLFPQPLEGVDTERRMTQRCVAYISKQSLLDTFQRVSEHLGCDEKTVRNVANAYIDTKDEDHKPYLPEWLGLDETHLNDIMRAVITDVGNRRPIDMLPDRDKPLLRKWFRQFSKEDMAGVKGLAIDMWAPYRDVAGELFENLPVVVDKFHVVKMANKSVETTRVRLGKKLDPKVRRSWMRSKALIRMRYRDLSDKQRFNLDMWLDNEPEMAQAYLLKERLFDIYDKPKAAAIEDYDSFASAVPDSLKADFFDLTRAMKNWRKEILNYFDYPITNAYTEALNGVAKVANRMGRGYSFEVIRARVLFSDRKPSKRQLRARKAAEAEKANMHRCFCCSALFRAPPLGPNPDHIQAWSAEGTVMDNGMTLCAVCNERFHHEEGFLHELLSTD